MVIKWLGSNSVIYLNIYLIYKALYPNHLEFGNYKNANLVPHPSPLTCAHLQLICIITFETEKYFLSF